MRRAVWKYLLKISSAEQVLELPLGAKMVHVGLDPGASEGGPTVWAEVDPDEARMIKHRFWVHGTGHDIPPGRDHLGSVIDPPFAWHVYHSQELNKYGSDY